MGEQLAHNIIDLPPMSADTPLYNEVAAPHIPESDHLLPATTETHEDEAPMSTEDVLHGIAYRQAVESALADPDSLKGIKAVVGNVPDQDAAHLLGVGAGNAAVEAHRAEMAKLQEEATHAANQKLDRAERERAFSEHYGGHDINGAFAVLDEARARARVEGWDEFDALQGKLHPSESEAYLRYVDDREPLNQLTDEQILALGQDDIEGFSGSQEADYFKRLQAIKGAEHATGDRSKDGTSRPLLVDGPVNGRDGGGEKHMRPRDRLDDNTVDLSHLLPIQPDRPEVPGAGQDNGQPPQAAEQLPRDVAMDQAAQRVLEAARARGQGGEADTPTGFGAVWRGIRGRAGQRPRLFREGLLPRIKFNRKPSADGPERVAEMDARDAVEAAELERRYQRLQHMAGRTATGQEVLPPTPPNQQRGDAPLARPVESSRPVASGPAPGDPLDELLRQQ